MRRREFLGFIGAAAAALPVVGRAGAEIKIFEQRLSPKNRFCVQAVQETPPSAFRTLSLVVARPFATQCEQFYTVVIVALSLALRLGLVMQ